MLLSNVTLSGSPFGLPPPPVGEARGAAVNDHLHKEFREALLKSARADSERFCFPGKDEKQRNTGCIS